MSTKQEVLKIIFGNEMQVNREALDNILALDNPKETIQKLLPKLNKNILTIQPGHLSLLTEEEPREQKPNQAGNIILLENHTTNKPVTGLPDLINYFTSRYAHFQKILRTRIDNTLSINHTKNMVREKLSVIAMISSIRETKKGNILLDLEDPTGEMRAVITKPELKEKANSILPDEVLAISGTMGDGIMFADDVTWPDIPVKNELKKLEEDARIALMSDTHFGSTKFMREGFEKFIDWVNKKTGTPEQKEIVDKLRYILLAGDVVDGIGVYPNQKAELETDDIYEQYAKAAEHLSKIPKRIKIVISPGNHDYVRLAQPQPPLDEDVAAPLYELDNVVMVSNPAMVRLFPEDKNGLDVLMYHGVSIDSMIPLDPGLRNGYKQPELVMKALMRRRHLSPPYASGLLAGGEDTMIMKKVPDILHTGHVHSNGYATYRGVSLVNSGTWQGQTDYQKLCGHEPTPCNLPIINIKTRELRVLDFTPEAK